MAFWSAELLFTEVRSLVPCAEPLPCVLWLAGLVLRLPPPPYVEWFESSCCWVLERRQVLLSGADVGS